MVVEWTDNEVSKWNWIIRCLIGGGGGRVGLLAFRFSIVSHENNGTTNCRKVEQQKHQRRGTDGGAEEEDEEEEEECWIKELQTVVELDRVNDGLLPAGEKPLLLIIIPHLLQLFLVNSGN